MPTRSPATDARYRNRARQLEAAASRVAGREASPLEVAKYVMARTDLDDDSFRQYRVSLTTRWKEIAKQFPEKHSNYDPAIALMKTKREKPKDEAKKPLRTSQRKKKKGIEDELDRICLTVLATRSPNRQALAAYLKAGILAGARFCEWPTAKFCASQQPGFKFQLTFANGKRGNGRAHGERRTLLWEDLTAAQIRNLKKWIEISARATEKRRYETLQDSLGDLMHDVSEKLFRKDRQLRPTLSSVRHAAVSRWKQAYIAEAKTAEAKQRGRAIVAALMGHASDESATKHYARARKGSSKYPIPRADPAEVARVLPRYSEPPFLIDKPSAPHP